MTNITRFAVACACALVSAAPAYARAVTMPVFDGSEPAVPLAATALSLPVLPPLATATTFHDDDAQTARRPVAFEYSEGYKIRAKIHKYASFATLPLFATEAALGQSLYTNSPLAGDNRKTAHQAIGASIGILFAANTVTGVWNLWEGRKDPSAGKRRWVHGLLMLASDVGFLLTANAVPNTHTFNGLLNYETDKSTHRKIAYTSIGVATVGYTIMLFGGK